MADSGCCSSWGGNWLLFLYGMVGDYQSYVGWWSHHLMGILSFVTSFKMKSSHVQWLRGRKKYHGDGSTMLAMQV